MKKADRPRGLALLVEDSGRTWAVMYDEINLIPPDAVERGDVFIARNRTKPGVMVLQAVAPKPNGWVLEAIQLEPEAEGSS